MTASSANPPDLPTLGREGRAERAGRRRWPWLVVLLILLVTGFIRFRLLDIPLERDEGEYAYAGQLILQGIPPYELAYNMKLPGTYFAYAAGMALFGQSTAGVHLMLLVVNSLSCIFVFLLGRKLAGNRNAGRNANTLGNTQGSAPGNVGGLAACASYAVLSMSPAVLGMAAHATHFVVFFALPGLLLFWEALGSGRRRTFFLAGLLFGLAFLMKQPGLCFGLFGFAMLLGRGIGDRSIFTRSFRLTLLSYGAAVALPFAGFCLVAWGSGIWERFWFWTFQYAASYGTGNSLADGYHALASYCHDTLRVYAGFCVLAVAGLVATLWGRPRAAQAAAEAAEPRNATVFVLGLLFFSFVGTAAGLYFREHYFILMLPAFALLVGLAVESLATLGSSRMRVVAAVLLGLVLPDNVWAQRRLFFESTRGEVCERLYPGNPFPECVAVGRWIREHSTPEARVAVVGSEPQIYFYARRHSATGYIYTYALMEAQPYASLMQREMIQEIERAQPEFLVIVENPFSWLKRATSDEAIFEWAGKYADRNYVRVPADGWSEGSLVLFRRDRTDAGRANGS
jgi:4-amino-4-deoxy-L-arabinose transferase-like glycosyltransferase